MRDLVEAALWGPFPPNRKLVLVSLCESARADGRVWTGERFIAARMRLSPRRVRDHLASLERDGWLQTTKAPSPGRATIRQLSVARIKDAGRRERERFYATHRRDQIRSTEDVTSSVKLATEDTSDPQRRTVASTNGGRQRPKNQELTKSIRTTAQASTSPPPDPPKAPTVAGLVDQYRTLPGILGSDRDGSRFAWLTNTFPAAEVRAALVKHGPTLAIRAREDPISLLHAIIKNERAAETSAQASFRRAEAVRDSLDRVVVGRSAETEAVWDEVRASLGIQNGNGAADTHKATISAADAAKRSGMALIGDHLPPTPQRLAKEAVPA